MVNITPPQRNELGLLENVEYAINEAGTVDWRKMIKPEFLVLNLQYQDKLEQVYGKPITEITASEVEDKYLLILLGGIKELARFRGFSSLTYKVSPVGELFVAATCEIKWIPNFETEGREIIFSDAADATNTNATGFGKSYLTAVAVNRAFVRTVRNFLGVNIVGRDEIGDKPNTFPEISEEPEDLGHSSPHVMLQNIFKSKGLTFQKVKSVCMAKGDEGAESWECIYDIPKKMVFDLMTRINNKKT